MKNNIIFSTGQAGSDTWVICMDLQQALTLPKLTSGIAFYKRKLWSLNFGIHDYKTNRGYMYVWNEVTANRGAIEICSCVFKFIKTQVPAHVKTLVKFSDNCPGQNKNYTMILFYLYLIHSGQFEEVSCTVCIL